MKTKKSADSLAAGEHIRVVPPYRSKPSVSIDELARRRRAKIRDEDLFAGKVSPPSTPPRLVYHGGPLLTNVEVYTVFWGLKWGGAAGKSVVAKVNAFFTTILTSSLLTQLAEYSVPGQRIGHGSLIGTKTISANAPKTTISDSGVQKQLKQWITAGTLPMPNKNTLYFVYLDPGITAILSGSRSCTGLCGYHSNLGKVYYAVMPYPSCSGCLGPLKSPFDALTGASSHELCEAITDPVAGSGWYDSANGEIGDICAWRFKKVAGYNVQLEWSNQQNKCV